ncbi:palmitoyltransferase ZDHHC20-B-like [Dermacentor andersoni]|uniref:palmitoyltransferase ZDHHC20-B-like n=1 Tax=Dermacentor andersoni TaxID=34620 RepID=UPI0021558DE3|nr:palmitoyltransferase ZDHHC20-B-like [Dermacentor andersoni]
MPRGRLGLADPFFEWLPVVGVVALLIWTYYAYVTVLCGRLVEDDVLRRLLVVAFHALFVLCVWSFVYTTFTGRIPAYFSVSVDEKQRLDALTDFHERRLYLDELGDKRGILTLGPDGCVRYCAECQRIKPDRCHHCSWCRRCVPKMDHHCPWFNNCVSFTTQKSFLLTLVYSSLLAGFVAATSVIHAVLAWFGPGLLFAAINVSALVIGGTYLSVGLGGFFYVHLNNMYRNVTTLENMRATMFREPEDSFDIGCAENVAQVFGRFKPLWAIPVLTSLGDGTRFPTKLHPDPNNLQLPLVRAVKDAPAATPGSSCAVAPPRPALVPAAVPATLGPRIGFPQPPLPVRGPSLVGPTHPLPKFGDYPRMTQPSTTAAPQGVDQTPAAPK